MITPPRAFALAVGVLAALAVTPAAARAAIPNPCGLGVARPATYTHVVVIFEENDTYAKVIGSPNAPYLNTLASDCALATNYHHDATVSQPNYMAVTGGNATGVSVHVNAPSIFSQASSWVELEEGMSSNCGGTATFYKRGHDPAFWYTPLASACKQDDIPAANRDAGLASLPNPLPAYTFITPNLCHNHHWQTGCSGRTRRRPSWPRWTRGFPARCSRSPPPATTRRDERSS